jgi:chloramphenicol-sensitive protein RarD
MSESGRGAWFAVGAYGFWGIAPIYFIAVKFASADEVLVHRIIWSVLLLATLVTVTGQWRALIGLFRTPAQLAWLSLSGALIAGNWLIFIWALQNGRMVDTSLGYYINPLVNVLLGFLFLGERLRGLQWLALLLAATGVANEIANAGGFPWIGLSLAISFGTYGLVRKRVGVSSILGLTVETILLAPLAIIYFLWLKASGAAAFGSAGIGRDLALVAAGLVTTIPLVWFAAAAMRLSLTVLGFFQYLAPSMVLLLAIFVYGEPFRPAQAITFGCIWSALLIFTGAALYDRRRLAYLSDRV